MTSSHPVSGVPSMSWDEHLALLPGRFYEKAEESQLPDILRDCMALFRSEAMFLLLSNFTGLKLHFLAPSEEDEPEDKKERAAVSAAENTEEGTSHSSSEPEDSRAATSDSSLQSDGPTDPEPEEDDGKKGELLLCCVLSLPLGSHNSVVYSVNRYFLSTYLCARPCFWSWRSRQTQSQLSLSPYILVGERPEIKWYTNNKMSNNICGAGNLSRVMCGEMTRVASWMQGQSGWAVIKLRSEWQDITIGRAFRAGRISSTFY